MSQIPLHYEKRKDDLCYRSNEGKNKRVALRCSPHLHREIEVVCFFEGRAIAYADSIRCELEPGDVFIAFPNQIHHYETLEPEKYYLFIVNPEIMPELANQFHLGLPHSPVIKGIANQPRVRETIEALYYACGRENEMIEWQRSTDDAGVRAKEDVGHHNRDCPTKQQS
jgi:hypothetical protein